MTDTDRKRASLFGNTDQKPETPPSKSLNLDRFTPKPAIPVDIYTVDAISKDAGFTTKHAKPAAPVAKKRDGRSLRRSPRTNQFNVRLQPKTADRFWGGAEKEGMEYADDFLAQLLDIYEGRGR